ncbi:UDP-N-acetylglucosamine--N-acetylmuramyl-(pentapeptide) pyrophosphoryl-undecaprenol N-acetylglucosamine transferase [Sinobacterium norvegicum]|uniref:UDP-N-acetylglucosamine--N-acetylmuramyl-(pentapeptide) pyrophosphoryl-undecaprenol N-acetylglucosamine transferase n=1 Tax=Sinobacterium norvegicum TaxID=1641715 RepID=A0ABN8EPE7_9GAMM|nr:undecaprenyldiphospho-muramoylpentapeptide beta-N-acetylglucosaminyltransferase [Sinobacterium norvegicum]CAH0993165.1 UDP-N-acetylglucosamine--N-acetylmuramyl-(pentapeptide) pyrophosphoryl-undecaprenol N-acetylglucosamine transferase [Sinobacterium norvegicum]
MSKPIALIMAGGTGGHVFPALATAQKLVDKGYQIHWLGTERGIESRLVPAAGFDITYMKVTGVRGKNLGTLIKAPFALIGSIFQAYKTVKRLNPAVVLGMGGYASGPGAVAAWLNGKPLVIHEQNAVAGTTNRLSARFACRVLQAFGGAFQSSEQGEVVGNPVRDQLATVATPTQRKQGLSADSALKLLVVGGSLGALALNETVPAALALLPAEQRPEVFHQAGDGKQHSTIKRYSAVGVDARVEPFIDDMLAAYSEADLVICRAGALTVSELACVGVASILVPLPHAIDDHQTKNAEWLAEKGGAIVSPQKLLTAESLAEQINSLLGDKVRLLDMAEQSRAKAVPLSASRVADICQEVACG